MMSRKNAHSVDEEEVKRRQKNLSFFVGFGRGKCRSASGQKGSKTKNKLH